MAIYDDKTQGIIKSGNYFFINAIKSRTEAIFKASYIVGSNLSIEGKIEASFDLIVLGDVKAEDLDVKGNFTCLGNCNITNSITVQGKMFGKSVRAKIIDVHDEFMAQKTGADVFKIDGNIIVEQTLSVEHSAESTQKIICGETAYGAGTISAYEIITGEELDMDDGIKAIVQPSRTSVCRLKEDWIERLKRKYAPKNNYNSYLTELQENGKDIVLLEIGRWRKTLDAVGEIAAQQKFTCYDIGILLSLIELANSAYFDGWDKIAEWKQYLLDNFDKMANKEELEIPQSLTLENLVVGQRLKHRIHGLGTLKSLRGNSPVMAEVAFDSGKNTSFRIDWAIKDFSYVDDRVLSPEEILQKLYVRPKDYGEWIAYLNILRVYGDKLSKKLYVISMELLYSAIGIKSKYMIDRLQENGWEDNV